MAATTGAVLASALASGWPVVWALAAGLLPMVALVSRSWLMVGAMWGTTSTWMAMSMLTSGLTSRKTLTLPSGLMLKMKSPSGLMSPSRLA